MQSSLCCQAGIVPAGYWEGAYGSGSHVFGDEDKLVDCLAELRIVE